MRHEPPKPLDGQCCYCGTDLKGKPWLRTFDGRAHCNSQQCRLAEREKSRDAMRQAPRERRQFVNY